MAWDWSTKEGRKKVARELFYEARRLEEIQLLLFEAEDGKQADGLATRLRTMHTRIGDMLPPEKPESELPAGYKVYGVVTPLPGISRKVRAIIAAHSWEEAARAMGITRHYASNYGSITQNAEEIRIASIKPGRVYYRELSGEPIYELHPGIPQTP